MSDLIQVPMPQAAYRQWFFSGTGKSYTLDELDALIAPTYRVYRTQINRCISGLVHYAALHTLAPRDDINISRLRELILEMASFWGLDGGIDKGVSDRLEHQYGGAFDQAVSAAQRSGNVPDLTDQEKTDILNGLEVHAQEMSNDDPIPQIEECRTLMRQMRVEWQMDTHVPAQTTLTIGGMSL